MPQGNKSFAPAGVYQPTLAYGAEPRDIASHRCIVGRLKGPHTVWSMQSLDGQTSLTPPVIRLLSDGEATVDAAIAGLDQFVTCAEAVTLD